MVVLSALIHVLFFSKLSFVQAQNAIFRKIEMQEAIKQEAPLKVLDFSDDADHKQDESGNFTVAFVPLDSRVLFLWYKKKTH